MITAQQLDAWRTTAERFLPDAFVVMRPTSVSDDAGGWTDTYAQAAAGACRLSAIGPSDEALFAGRILDRADARATVPAGTDVRPTDRLVVTLTYPTSATRTFEVVGSTGPRSYEVVRVLALRETT